MSGTPIIIKFCELKTTIFKLALNQYIEIFYPFALIIYAKYSFNDQVISEFFYVQSIASISIIFSEVALNPFFLANGIMSKKFFFNSFLVKLIASSVTLAIASIMWQFSFNTLWVVCIFLFGTSLSSKWMYYRLNKTKEILLTSIAVYGISLLLIVSLFLFAKKVNLLALWIMPICCLNVFRFFILMGEKFDLQDSSESLPSIAVFVKKALNLGIRRSSIAYVFPVVAAASFSVLDAGLYSNFMIAEKLTKFMRQPAKVINEFYANDKSGLNLSYFFILNLVLIVVSILGLVIIQRLNYVQIANNIIVIYSVLTITIIAQALLNRNFFLKSQSDKLQSSLVFLLFSGAVTALFIYVLPFKPWTTFVSVQLFQLVFIYAENKIIKLRAANFQ